MEGSFICNKNENLNYDELYDKSSKLKEEYELDMQIDSINYFKKNNEEIRYSKEQAEDILKKCIENMKIEIECVINEKFEQYNFIATFNSHIDYWNEVLFSIEVNRKLIEIKLTNDYVCDDVTNINSVYITLFSGGKGIFTECIEQINQEYEFIGSTYAYVPVNENKLCFKELDKDRFIQCLVSEINKLI